MSRTKRTTEPKLYARGNVWWFHFTHEGSQYRESTGKKIESEQSAWTEAYRIWHSITSANQENFNPLRSDPGDTFDAFTKHLASIGRKKTTTDNYARYEERYVEFFGSTPLGEIRKIQVEQWRDWLLQQERKGPGRLYTATENLSPKSVSEHLNWLGAIYNHFELPNPTAKVVRPKISHSDKQKRVQFFSKLEMPALLSVCAERLKRFQYALTVFAFTGCRVGEVKELEPADLEPENQMAWVTGKGGKRRKLTLSGSAQPAWDAIQAAMQGRNLKPHDKIFNTTRQWYHEQMQYLCDFCEIPRRGPHVLRHTFATHALMYWRWDIARLSKWLGHESIQITVDTYGHLMPEAPPEIGY
jgi:integrase